MKQVVAGDCGRRLNIFDRITAFIGLSCIDSAPGTTHSTKPASPPLMKALSAQVELLHRQWFRSVSGRSTCEQAEQVADIASFVREHIGQSEVETDIDAGWADWT